MSSFLIYLIIFLILSASIVTYFRIADKLNIIDKPNQRSSHNHVTIRGGGIVLYFGILLYALFFGLTLPYFIIGLTIVSIVSFLDDMYDVSFKIRISVHFAAMMIMFYDCGFYDIPWYYLVAALIVSIGIINAYNFMDGINGITGGYSLIVIGSFWWINNHIHLFIDNNLLYVAIIALLIFNFFNFRKKARCFAGDIGAVSIAFIIVFLMGKLIVETGDWSYLIILMLYGVDSVLTIVHRLILKENIFRAHRKHIYQLMSNELSIPHTVVSLIYMAVQAVIIIGYFLILSSVEHIEQWIYFLGIAIVLAVGYYWFIKRYFRLHANHKKVSD